jgi:hypothetical protein
MVHFLYVEILVDLITFPHHTHPLPKGRRFLLSVKKHSIITNTISVGDIGCTMSNVSYNCIICANEFSSDELYSLALSKINVTHFKICQDCLDKSDPVDDFRQARDIVNSYIKLAEIKSIFSDVQEILDSIKKS